MTPKANHTHLPWFPIWWPFHDPLEPHTSCRTWPTHISQLRHSECGLTASRSQMRSRPYMEIFRSQAWCRGGDRGVGMELPNLSLSSAQALSMPVQLQENVVLTDTTTLAPLKQISAEGEKGAGGKTQVAMAQKTSTQVFCGAEILGELQGVFAGRRERGQEGREYRNTLGNTMHCPFSTLQWRNGTQETVWSHSHSRAGMRIFRREIHSHQAQGFLRRV